MISSNSQTVDLCAERPERELGHFERLDAERNADDGDAVEHACTQIAERHPAADQHHPQDVGQGRADSAAVLHGFAKRRQGESRHLERLNAERDADDGDAQNQSHQCPSDCDGQSTKNDPQDIAENSHD